MNLSGKKLKGIEIVKHEKGKAQVKLNKAQIEEIIELKRVNDFLNSCKISKSLLGNQKEEIQGLLRNLRAKQKTTNTEEFLNYNYEIPAHLQYALNGDPRTRNSTSIKKSGKLFVDKNKSIIDILKTIKDERLAIIRQGKEKLKQFRLDESRGDKKRFQLNFDGAMVNIPTIGGCNQTPGTMLQIKKAKKEPSPFKFKKPNDGKNYLGIELEFLCKLPSATLGFELAVSGLSKYCELKEDHSLRDEQGTGYYMHELAILVEEECFEDVINRICKILNKAGSNVNKTCGLHVHLDMRNRDHHNVFYNLVKSQDVLYDMQPKSRRDINTKEGGFCAKVQSPVFDNVFDGTDGDEMVDRQRKKRYLGINPFSMARHKTIEIRLHTGTTNANKINNWIKILLSIVNNKNKVEQVLKLDEFKKTFEINETLYKYMKERIKKFSATKSEAEVEKDGEAA